jgi:nitroimidazol reductase NimA-like FMN-containing flavoprotein (pyridoxamine 5'-phosphate oxidase superfamily)
MSVELPHWPDGTVAILATGAGAPHAIPVSTIVRAGPRTILLALGHRRESLARLREEPRCALVIHAEDLTVTVHGHAEVVNDLGRVVAVRVDVDEILDHARDDFAVDGGIAWRWTDTDAERADAEVRAQLEKLVSPPRS